MNGPRRQRGIRIRLDLIVKPVGGGIAIDPLMDALKAAAKEMGLKPIDVDWTGFEEVRGNPTFGWEGDGMDTPW